MRSAKSDSEAPRGDGSSDRHHGEPARRRSPAPTCCRTPGASDAWTCGHASDGHRDARRHPPCRRHDHGHRDRDGRRSHRRHHRDRRHRDDRRRHRPHRHAERNRHRHQDDRRRHRRHPDGHRRRPHRDDRRHHRDHGHRRRRDRHRDRKAGPAASSTGSAGGHPDEDHRHPPADAGHPHRAHRPDEDRRRDRDEDHRHPPDPDGDRPDAGRHPHGAARGARDRHGPREDRGRAGLPGARPGRDGHRRAGHHGRDGRRDGRAAGPCRWRWKRTGCCPDAGRADPAWASWTHPDAANRHRPRGPAAGRGPGRRTGPRLGTPDPDAGTGGRRRRTAGRGRTGLRSEPRAGCEAAAGRGASGRGAGAGGAAGRAAGSLWGAGCCGAGCGIGTGRGAGRGPGLGIGRLPNSVGVTGAEAPLPAWSLPTEPGCRPWGRTGDLPPWSRPYRTPPSVCGQPAPQSSRMPIERTRPSR